MSALRLGCEARLLDPRIVGPSSLAAHRRRGPRVAAVLRWPLQSVRLLRLLWLLKSLKPTLLAASTAVCTETIVLQLKRFLPE